MYCSEAVTKFYSEVWRQDSNCWKY